MDGVDNAGDFWKATLERISPLQRQQIQAFADKYNVEVIVTGSRARGNIHGLSDYDYIIRGGKAKIRSKVGRYLPRGPRYDGEFGPKPGFDLIPQEAFDPKFTHIIFSPVGSHAEDPCNTVGTVGIELRLHTLVRQLRTD
ncbi:MAG: hypothetical protein R3C28_24140 [Pirellulaceae bacterium]